MIEIRTTGPDDALGIELWADPAGRPERLLAGGSPVVLEIHDGDPSDWRGTRVARGYTHAERDGDALLASARIATAAGEVDVLDRWAPEGDGVRVDRSVRVHAAVPGTAVRAVLDLDVVGNGFDERAQVFAPPALYDLNDVDGDGVEDYLDTRELVFRDDRLTGLAVLAYAAGRGIGLALTRQDLPSHDDVPDRARGQQAFAQRTDIGSLGLVPRPGGWSLTAAYPFVERPRSHALTVRDREPWGAFWPVDDATDLRVSYGVGVVTGESATDALWQLWRARVEHLQPRRVELPVAVEDLTALRLDALLPYYRENATTAGFVTNCHPQDGRQLGDVLQYGFTGQTVLNALHVLRHAPELDDAEAGAKALRTVESFVRRAGASPLGLVHTLYDFDTQRDASWWSGLLLPLAYADEGADLQKLMGPVVEHMGYAIDALQGAPDGTYLRCVAEEHHALLRAYAAEREAGTEHAGWLDVARSFGEFLLGAQEPDGSWRRAYAFDGSALVEPRSWFGRAELNQKSSTATAVPFLEELHRATGDPRWQEAAVRAARFVAEHFVRGLKFNGGIHDSIYARAQLVDSESILFSLRACLAGAELTGDDDLRSAAVDAARVLATWVYLWDVPLPPGSTMARFGFRSTGWSACDTAGAGYIHPYELHAVPDLFEAALLADDDVLAEVADLVLHGSNETVATEACDWGYARPGLQEEGLLVSWWLVDDPMFVDTGFGGRGKGEGNKTCLPWISAVGIDATDEVLRRYGTTDLRARWRERTRATVASR
ncbi:hypothetical protein [Cellulomonas endometrii]|uniref:hypothetical protein n=1 Tax=Cellulomonas endometrii TaxID=3036301 RepID=UPI0024ADB0E4|nr:hypothetical protein [Cellulomonas endometrii]